MSNETLARLLATHQLEYFDGTCTGCDWDYENEPEGDDVELVIYHARHVANLVAAAGYRKPRTLVTHDELDALPDFSVILLAAMTNDEGIGIAAQKEDDEWFTVTYADPVTIRDEALPAIVLYVPEES